MLQMYHFFSNNIEIEIIILQSPKEQERKYKGAKGRKEQDARKKVQGKKDKGINHYLHPAHSLIL
jgi:hypothetical protein